MGKLNERLRSLRVEINRELKRLIYKKGVYTGHSIKNGIEVNKVFYVEGRMITHITEEVLIADGLHYGLSCIEIGELIELIESLE